MAITRHNEHHQHVVQLGDIEFDVANGLLRQHTREIHLTPTEAQLLNVLVVNQGRYVSHRVLLEEVWHGSYAPHYIRVYMRRLRGKLQALGATAPSLEAARGMGYRLHVCNDSTSSIGFAA